MKTKYYLLLHNPKSINEIVRKQSTKLWTILSNRITIDREMRYSPQITINNPDVIADIRAKVKKYLTLDVLGVTEYEKTMKEIERCLLDSWAVEYAKGWKKYVDLLSCGLIEIEPPESFMERLKRMLQDERNLDGESVLTTILHYDRLFIDRMKALIPDYSSSSMKISEYQLELLNNCINWNF